MVLPPPLAECSIEDVVRVCLEMKSCIADNEKNKARRGLQRQSLWTIPAAAVS